MHTRERYPVHMRCGLPFAFLLLFTPPAHAVLVRGHVTTPLGVPLAAARVQLISLDPAPRSAADAITGLDGSYEIRTDLAGRFLLLTAPSVLNPNLAPQIGNPFYAGRTDLLTLDIRLDTTAISPQLTTVSTRIDTPLRQLAAPPIQISADHLLSQSTPIPDLRSTPSAFLVQFGQLGAPATLYLRGAPVTKILIDGISAEDLSGPYRASFFNLATLTSTGLSALASTPALELSPTPDPVHFLDSSSGVLALHTPTAASPHPVLTYTGGAGNLSTTRNEATVTLAHTRTDLLASFSRLNTDNDRPAARLHLITSAANLGYYVSASTSLRLTVRDDTSATPLSLPYSFYNLQPSDNSISQNLYTSLIFSTSTTGDWHNSLRYGLARKRAQILSFSTPSTGLPVTILGANGYTATGTAAFPIIPPREDFVTNRDEFSFQTDRPLTHFLTGLLTARYQDERAADLLPYHRQSLERTHLSFAAALQGDIHHRLFYQTTGFLDRSPTFGLTGAPSLGLTYVPVRPGPRRLRGTSLHLTAATGVRELTLAEQAALPIAASPRSRTLALSVDQDLLPRKLFLRATYFHNQFSHEFEPLTLAPLTLSNALAYRTQGLETELRYQASPRLALQGGYTYLASLVERSAATPSFNPSLPNLPIGTLTALPGNRPFQRPPQTGFAKAAFTGRIFSASLRSAFASTSDDSTKLYLTPTLLLPNRNLSPACTSVDANITLTLTRHITLFSELNNLLDSRHIAPIGYLSTPFGAQIGLRLRLGRE